jgi:hypothetical protein
VNSLQYSVFVHNSEHVLKEYSLSEKVASTVLSTLLGA